VVGARLGEGVGCVDGLKISNANRIKTRLKDGINMKYTVLFVAICYLPDGIGVGILDGKGVGSVDGFAEGADEGSEVGSTDEGAIVGEFDIMLVALYMWISPPQSVSS
jgi:hypothetical protein